MDSTEKIINLDRDKVWAVISYMQRTSKKLEDCLILFKVTKEVYDEYKVTYPKK